MEDVSFPHVKFRGGEGSLHMSSNDKTITFQPKIQTKKKLCWNWTAVQSHRIVPPSGLAKPTWSMTVVVRGTITEQLSFQLSSTDECKRLQQEASTRSSVATKPPSLVSTSTSDKGPKKLSRIEELKRQMAQQKTSAQIEAEASAQKNKQEMGGGSKPARRLSASSEGVAVGDLRKKLGGMLPGKLRVPDEDAGANKPISSAKKIDQDKKNWLEGKLQLQGPPPNRQPGIDNEPLVQKIDRAKKNALEAKLHFQHLPRPPSREGGPDKLDASQTSALESKLQFKPPPGRETPTGSLPKQMSASHSDTSKAIRPKPQFLAELTNKVPEDAQRDNVDDAVSQNKAPPPSGGLMAELQSALKKQKPPPPEVSMREDFERSKRLSEKQLSLGQIPKIPSMREEFAKAKRESERNLSQKSATMAAAAAATAAGVATGAALHTSTASSYYEETVRGSTATSYYEETVRASAMSYDESDWEEALDDSFEDEEVEDDSFHSDGPQNLDELKNINPQRQSSGSKKGVALIPLAPSGASDGPPEVFQDEDEKTTQENRLVAYNNAMNAMVPYTGDNDNENTAMVPSDKNKSAAAVVENQKEEKDGESTLLFNSALICIILLTLLAVMIVFLIQRNDEDGTPMPTPRPTPVTSPTIEPMPTFHGGFPFSRAPTMVPVATEAPAPITETPAPVPVAIPTLVPIGTYSALAWSELPDEVREAAEVLGYNEEIWNNGTGAPETESLYWDELTPEQQAAAMVFGYDQESWDGAITWPTLSPFNETNTTAPSLPDDGATSSPSAVGGGVPVGTGAPDLSANTTAPTFTEEWTTSSPSAAGLPVGTEAPDLPGNETMTAAPTFPDEAETTFSPSIVTADSLQPGEPTFETATPSSPSLILGTNEPTFNSSLPVAPSSFLQTTQPTFATTLAPSRVPDNSQPTMATTTTEAPQFQLTNSPTVAALPGLVFDFPPYTYAALIDPASPQSKALDWLSEDPSLASYPGWQQQQRFALACFFYSFNGEAWPELLRNSWMQYDDGSECDWASDEDVEYLLTIEDFSVSVSFLNSTATCNDEDRYISLGVYDGTAISTEFHQEFTATFVGTVPPEVSLLTSLERMSIHTDVAILEVSMGELLPPQLQDLTNLTTLDIANCYFREWDLTVVAEMPALETLDLSYSDLDSTMPTDLGLLTNLERLDVSYSYRLSFGEQPVVSRNGVTTVIPSEIGLLSDLEVLSLSGNRLSGAVPSELGALTSLETLLMSACNIQSFPPFTLTNLQRLDLSFNVIEGTMPATLGKLAALEYLDLNSNRMTGPMPPQIGLLTLLNNLNVVDNRLSGPLPDELSQASSLQVMDLAKNKFSGSLPPSFFRLGSLRELNVGSNFLSGSLATDIGFAQYLQTLILENNRMTGSLPNELGQATSLLTLDIPSNAFTGTIPWRGMAQATSLSYFDGSDNDFSGTIDRGVGLMTSLETLALRYNDLSGSLPPEIRLLESLELLDMTQNRISGAIPSEIGLLSWRLSHLFLDWNLVTDRIPTQIGLLTRLTSLAVRGYTLVGEIPEEVGDMTSLELLLLSGNPLTGFIPTRLGFLTALSTFGLELTTISGAIPSQLGLMQSLQNLYLNATDLSGSVPSEVCALPLLDAIWVDCDEVSCGCASCVCLEGVELI